MIGHLIAHIEDSLLSADPGGGDTQAVGSLDVGMERIPGMDDLMCFQAQPRQGPFEDG